MPLIAVEQATTLPAVPIKLEVAMKQFDQSQ